LKARPPKPSTAQAMCRRSRNLNRLPVIPMRRT
jgi:hypothetical protein